MELPGLHYDFSTIGGQMRCCYRSDDGSLVSADNTNNGLMLHDYQDAGFVTRYPLVRDVRATKSI